MISTNKYVKDDSFRGRYDKKSIKSPYVIIYNQSA